MAKVVVDESVCKGCGMCVTACPKQLLTLSKEHRNNKGYHPAVMTDAAQCVGCAACAIMCPDVAITVER